MKFNSFALHFPGVTSDGSHKGQSDFHLRVNRAPVTGRCRFPETRYIFLTELLSFECSGFWDREEHYPLTYELYAKIKGTDEELLPRGVLLFHDVYSKGADIYLPLGHPFDPPDPALLQKFAQSTSQERQIQHKVQVTFVVSDFFGLEQQLDPIEVEVSSRFHRLNCDWFDDANF
jgi:hypothetical protein